MNDIEIYNQPLHLYDAKEYAREHGCSTPDDGAILYFKNEYPKGIDVDNDTSVYTYDKPIGKLVGHVNNGDIYLVNGKNISYYCLVKNNFENEQNLKNTVKLNESQLRKIVAESVKKVLKEGYYDADFRGPNDTEHLAGDILEFILKAEKKYPKSNRYEAVKQVLDACGSKNNITYEHEDDMDHGHTFGH